MLVFVLFLGLTGVLALHPSHSQTCKSVNYTYYTLALTWPNQFCFENKCSPKWSQQWDGYTFTIHGFWPSSTDLSYLTCFKNYGYDPNCYYAFDFSQKLFTKAELAELNKYWPKLGEMSDFWGYQWKKHGTCYLSKMKNQFKSTKSPAEIFKLYFMGTVAKLKKLDLSLNYGKYDSKAALAKVLNLDVSQFYAICGYDNSLDEIRICFGVSNKEGEELIAQCPKSTDRQQCKFPVIVS